MAMFGTLSPFDPIDPRYLAGGFGTQADHPLPTPIHNPFTPAATPNPYEMQPQHPAFFGQGGAGRAIAGSIGDALLQLSHAQPIYAPAMQAQREFEQRRQQAQEDSQNTLNNELALYDYKLKNPEPDTPDDFTRTMTAAGIDPTSPAGRDLYNNRVHEMSDPVVTTPTGMMLRSQAIAQMTGEPAPAGVTFTPIGNGGPTPSASGNFPNIARYYGGQ